MLSVQRRKEIFRILHSQGQVQLNDLANQFRVSIMTIRRDLELLEQEGKARRVHGGAVISELLSVPDTIDKKSVMNVEKKRQIAQNILPLIGSCNSMFLDAGSTAYEIAKAMCTHVQKELTVCTIDLHIADLLRQEERFQVYFCGGMVDRSTASVGGEFSVQMIRALHADLAVIGCDALTVKDGAMGARIANILVKQAMIEHSLRCALVVDSTKFSRVSFATIAPLSAFDFLVSDDEVSEDVKLGVLECGVEIIPPAE